MSGAETAPAWVAVLEAAKEWNRPPWEIDHYIAPIVWWVRWNIYKKLLIEAQASSNGR